MNSDLFTAHSRSAIGAALSQSGEWSGTRHGVRLKLHLERNLLGEMIVCEYRVGKVKRQVIGSTVFEIGNELRSKLRRI